MFDEDEDENERSIKISIKLSSKQDEQDTILLVGNKMKKK